MAPPLFLFLYFALLCTVISNPREALAILAGVLVFRIVKAS